MTDQEHLEISRKLALAIGWTTFAHSDKKFLVWIAGSSHWEPFDYRDWNVIGPIAERFDCFPDRCADGMWLAFVPHEDFHRANTPQLAIALAVIEGVK